MANKITIYEKPTCSTCRIVIEMLTKKGVKFDAVNYYQKPFTKAGLKSLLGKMNARPRDILRRNEEIYRKLDLGADDYGDDEILELMVKHPDLIQRPIVVKGDSVILARPPERLKEIL